MNKNIIKEDQINVSAKGQLSFNVINKTTGEIVDTFNDHNIVVLDARKILIKLLFEDRPSYRVNRVKIGDDVGSGTPSDPEPPSETYAASDMSVVYDTTDGISVNYSDDLTTVYNIFISGQDVMDQYPNEDSVDFTSLGLYSNNNLLFSCRRFAARTITANFNVNIFWSIYYETV